MISSQLEAEFEDAAFGDRRLDRRLATIGRAMGKDPSASFPALMVESELEGAYRFFSNPSVDLEGISGPHRRETLRRMAARKVVLAVHDTTTLSFRPEGKRTGFAETVTTKTQQLWAHTTLAVSADGLREPLGVLHASTEPKIVHGRWVAHIELCQGLASSNQLVHVMDREADDFALFTSMLEMNARFVVRLQHDRKVGQTLTLREAVSTAPLLVEREVMLGARASQHLGSKQRRTHPARDGRRATLQVRACEVHVRRPVSADPALPATLKLNLVRVSEPEPPADEQPVEWLLFTTEPIEDPDAVLRVVDWYRARWTIEEFFKAMKTGCSIEKRQLETFDGLSKAYVLFAPIAWHLLVLRRHARADKAEGSDTGKAPTPADAVLGADELTALRGIAKSPLPKAPTARDAALAIAALGGHLKRNGDPGWLTLARGYEKLRLVVLGLNLRCDQS